MQLKLVHTFDIGPAVEHPWRVFCSILPMDTGGHVGVLREHDPADGEKTRLRRVTFSDYKMQEDKPLCKGEDPRIFRDGEAYYARSWRAGGNCDWDHCVVNLRSGVAYDETHGRARYHGKNWVPVIGEKSGRYNRTIRSLDPLSFVHDDTWPATIGEYRGGGVAYQADGVIRGFGHRTIDRDTHRPFLYTLTNKGPRFTPLDVPEFAGYGIIDPTSSWGDYVVLCITKHGWYQQCETIHGLFKLEE